MCVYSTKIYLPVSMYMYCEGTCSGFVLLIVYFFLSLMNILRVTSLELLTCFSLPPSLPPAAASQG